MGFRLCWICLIEKAAIFLQLFVKLANRAGNIHAARHAALAVLHAFHNPGRFRALGAIRALSGIHFLFTVARFRNLGHNVPCLLQLGDPPD